MSDIQTVFVVLGAPTKADGKPGPDLKQRLDKCLSALAENNDCKVVVTGGNPQTYGSAGLVSEAHCMQTYLVEHGVEPSRILVEDKAIHTFHNALCTKTLLRQGGILATTKPLVLTIITTDWHVKRALVCFKLIYCDLPSIVLKTEVARPPDPNDGMVIERVIKEARLIRDWIPMCLEEERDHSDMPSASMIEQSGHLDEFFRKRSVRRQRSLISNNTYGTSTCSALNYV